MEIGRFNSEADARKFLGQRIQKNHYLGDLLEKSASLSQILILIGLFFSLWSGFFIPFSYAVGYNQAWIFSRIVSGNYIKLFSLGFIFVVFGFYIPIIFVFLGKHIKNKYLNFFYFYLFIPFISIVLMWPYFEKLMDIKVNYCASFFAILIFIYFLIFIFKSFIEKDDVKYFSIIIPVFILIILILSPFFNFSRIVIQSIGIGDRWIFLQIASENPSKINSEFKMLQSELKNYSSTKNIYCLFFQSGKSLYITKDLGRGVCTNQFKKGNIGPLIRVPMKYVISIGEPLPPTKKSGE